MDGGTLREACSCSCRASHQGEVVRAPALALDLLPEDEWPKAAQLYGSFDEAVAEKIDAMVGSKRLQFAPYLPDSVSSKLKDSMFVAWLQARYIKVAGRVLEDAAGNIVAIWACCPKVTIE